MLGLRSDDFSSTREARFTFGSVSLSHAIARESFAVAGLSIDQCAATGIVLVRVIGQLLLQLREQS